MTIVVGQKQLSVDGNLLARLRPDQRDRAATCSGGVLFDLMPWRPSFGRVTGMDHPVRPSGPTR